PTTTIVDGKEVKVAAAPVQIGTSITNIINEEFKDNPHEIRRVDTVGPQVGEELKQNSILAALYSLMIILIYVGLRFDYKYAPGAVFCLLHDAIFMIAIYSVFGQEVNVQTLAAILTLMGVALNATIILYDRIRENEAEHPGEPFDLVVNKSHNDILSRTIITTVTIELSVIALYFLSDGVVQQIAYTLMIGVLLGAFSSTYVAGTIVIELDRWQKSREAVRLKRRTSVKA
ncbi:MAG: protein translocase subunit SecF, partial [Bdellovibrionota bacterium]